MRGQEVILASEVAKLYGVETKVINQAVKNNPDKFPEGYVFQLTKEEVESSRSKILTLNNNKGRGHNIKYLPKAFTEKGLYMLATILKSPIATQTTIAIVETFATVRELKREIHDMHDEKDKTKQLSRIEKIGHIIADLMNPDLQTSETESSMEVSIFHSIPFSHQRIYRVCRFHRGNRTAQTNSHKADGLRLLNCDLSLSA